MIVNKILRFLLLACMASLVAGCEFPNEKSANIAGQASAGQTAKVLPNIVWIIGDDQAYGDFGFMGHKIVKTPNIDRLASQSAVFPNGYVPTSLCRASLATLITGKYAFDHGICFNDPPAGTPQSDTFGFLKMQVPLPLELQKRGYRSMQTGKFWEGAYSNGGFTDGMSLGGRHGDAGLAIGRKTMEPIDSFLGRTGDQPFFIWFAPYLPHTPHDADPRFIEPYQNKGLDPKTTKYYANISWFDETVGQLTALLEKHGKADNTIIMFIIDNGWAPMLNGDSFRDVQGRELFFDPRSKSSPYEHGVRTPIMIKWPGRIRPARHDALLSSIDFFPTALAMANLPKPTGLQGYNLVPFLERKASLRPRTIFGEIYFHTSTDLGKPAANVTHRWARKGKWKLIVNDLDHQRAELYDLSKDPGEQRNLAMDPAHRDTLAAMTAEIDLWYPLAKSAHMARN